MILTITPLLWCYSISVGFCLRTPSVLHVEIDPSARTILGDFLSFKLHSGSGRVGSQYRQRFTSGARTDERRLSRPQVLRDCRALLYYDPPHFGDNTAKTTADQFESDKKWLAEVEAMRADEHKKRMRCDRAFAARIEPAYTRKWLESRRGRK